MNGACNQLCSVYWSRSSVDISTATTSGTTMISSIRMPPGSSIHSGRLRSPRRRRPERPPAGADPAGDAPVVTTPAGGVIVEFDIRGSASLRLVQRVLRSLLRRLELRFEVGGGDLARGQAGDGLHHDVHERELRAAPRSGERRAVGLGAGLQDGRDQVVALLDLLRRVGIGGQVAERLGVLHLVV